MNGFKANSLTRKLDVDVDLEEMFASDDPTTQELVTVTYQIYLPKDPYLTKQMLNAVNSDGWGKERLPTWIAHTIEDVNKKRNRHFALLDDELKTDEA